MSDKYEIQGTIKEIKETQQYSSGFTKRQFVVTTPDDKYPQDIALEVVKDKCASLDNYRPGDGVKVSFNLRGNEYNGKHYVQLAAWKIEDEPKHSVGARSYEYGQKEQRSPNQNTAPPPARDNGGGSPSNYEDDSEIPFGPFEPPF